jgi:hypothetical protein
VVRHRTFGRGHKLRVGSAGQASRSSGLILAARPEAPSVLRPQRTPSAQFQIRAGTICARPPTSYFHRLLQEHPRPRRSMLLSSHRSPPELPSLHPCLRVLVTHRASMPAIFPPLNLPDDRISAYRNPHSGSGDMADNPHKAMFGPRRGQTVFRRSAPPAVGIVQARCQRRRLSICRRKSRRAAENCHRL